MSNNQLNQQNIDHKGTQDDPNDQFQLSSLEKLSKIIEYNTTTSSQEPVKDFLGIVLKTIWVPITDDGFTEKDLLKANTPFLDKGVTKCIVRIPEIHSCIPEPKQPALQDPKNIGKIPNADDFYVLMHDEFYVDSTGYKDNAAPQPGDIVVCDYKYRDVRLGGIITSIYPKAGAAGGVKADLVEESKGTAAAFDTSAAQGHSNTVLTKRINPNYEGKLETQQKLEVLHPRLRVFVEKILKHLEADGRFDKRKIRITSTWRDSNKQARLTNKQNPPDPTNFSYHIVITDTPDSDYYEPQALACDISYPGRPGKGVTKAQTDLQEEFYEKLGELVEKENLTWGGRFEVKNYHSEYKKERYRRVQIGWDPQHMSMRNMLNSTQQGEIKAETKRIYKRLGQTKLK